MAAGPEAIGRAALILIDSMMDEGASFKLLFAPPGLLLTLLR
jgi:hypothetical protein